MQRMRSLGRLAQAVMLQGLLEDPDRCDEAIRLFGRMEDAAVELAMNPAAGKSTRQRSWGDAGTAAKWQAVIARRIGRLDEAREAIRGAEEHLAEIEPGAEPMLDGLIAAERLRLEPGPASAGLVSRIQTSIEKLTERRRRELAVMRLVLAEQGRATRGGDWFVAELAEIMTILEEESSISARPIRLEVEALQASPSLGAD